MHFILMTKSDCPVCLLGMLDRLPCPEELFTHQSGARALD